MKIVYPVLNVTHPTASKKKLPYSIERKTGVASQEKKSGKVYQEAKIPYQEY
jgi:hypothetical protein